jgi:hypothetical protein
MGKASLLENAAKAKKILGNLESIHDKLKLFHIRPASSDVTLVTTHEELAMRGIQYIDILKLKDFLEKLADAVDDEKWYERFEYDGKYFKDRSKESKENKEERELLHQARFINEIINYSNAFNHIQGIGELFFIGSELVFYEKGDGKKEIIDVVVHNGSGKVLFFELKDEQNIKDIPKAQAQVMRYIDKYVKNEKNKIPFEYFFRSYPTIHPIKDNVNIEFEGWVVICYKEGKSSRFEFEKASE